MTSRANPVRSRLRIVASLVALSMAAGESTAQSERIQALLDSSNAAVAGSTPSGYRTAVRLRLEALQLVQRTKNRRQEGQVLIGIGSAWQQLGELDLARNYALRAISLLMQAGDTSGAASALTGLLAPAYQGMGSIDSAVATHHRSAALARAGHDRYQEAMALQNLGALFASVGQADSAIGSLLGAFAVVPRTGDRRVEAVLFGNLAEVYQRQGNADMALRYGREAIRVAQEARSDSTAAIAHNRLGELHAWRGSRDSSLDHYRAALTAAGRARDQTLRRTVLLNTGFLLKDLGQFDSAAVYVHLAIAASREVKDFVAEAQGLDAIGDLFKRAGQRDSARAYYGRALVAYRTVQDGRNEALSMLNLVETDPSSDSALRYANQARDRGRQMKDLHVETVALNLMGRLALERQADSAVTWYRESLRLSRQGSNLGFVYRNLRDLGSLYFLGSNFRVAAAYYDSADAVRTLMRTRSGADFNRTTLGEQDGALYAAWMYSWLSLVPTSGVPALNAALAATERGRAQALLDLMTDAGPPGSTVDLPSWGRDLIASAGRSGTATVVYYAGIPGVVHYWVTVPGKLPFVGGILITPDSLRNMVNRLRNRLGVDQGGTRLSERGLPPERGAIGASQGSGDWRATAAALSRTLFPAELRQRLTGVREMLVIPHGVIALVPFSLLPWNAAADRLGDHVAVRFAPSVATANAAEARPKPIGAPQALVVGDPAMPLVGTESTERLRLAPLPGAAREAQLVAARLGTASLGGSAATESVVRRLLSSASVVHLASHGYAYSSEGEARNSFIALAADSVHDGLLTVGEILDDPAITLRADLVVLSACQTGLGDLKQAEGTIGLQRAFLAKGARSVLVSLWSVSDEATRLLMTRFYSHWMDDSDRPSKPQALRRAEADVRARPEFSHPKFWAGFQLVGAR